MLSFGQSSGIGNSSLTSFSLPSASPPEESETRKLCLKLRSSFSPTDWTNFESSLTPVRLGYFLENGEVKIFVESLLSKFPSHKDKAKGMTLKNRGNKAFGSGNNEEALLFYTKCLAWMPHDDGSSDAAIVYANRSAALFHLSKYSLSERDAKLAFDLGYPEELHYKLYERLARCCLETGKELEPSNHLEKAIHSLSQAKGLDETKQAKTRSTLESLLNACRSNSKNAEKSLSSNSVEKDNISFGTGITITNGSVSGSGGGGSGVPNRLPLPEVVGGRSQYLKCCSKGLLLKSSEKKGRFVVATEAFRPGDVILVEKAYVSVLLPQHYHLQCFQCYSPMEAPIMCKTCIYASYCSTECEQKSWSTHHQYECGSLGALKHAGISVICYMALRILTQAKDPKEVLEWYNLIAPKNEKTNVVKDISSTEYKADHTAIFNLVTHLERRNAESDFHQILMTSFLINILRNTDYLRKAREGTNLSAGEVELKIGLVLHRCLQFLQFNTHETSGWNPDLPKDNSVGLGGGLFPTLALFNHSCNPALVRYFINDAVIVRAIRTIRPGEEVTENYGPCFITHPLRERQKTLWDQFWFECDCIPCQQDWPTFDKLTMEGVRFRCDNCGAYICRVDENMGLLFKCGRCAHNVNILKNLKSLQESEQRYKQAMDCFDNGDESNALGILLENISLLDRHLMPPLKDMHVCQEHVRKCLLNCGNKISKLEAWNPEQA